MELKICHLYPDVMNLSCDRGNLICMEKRLQWRKIDVEIVPVQMGDTLDAAAFDLIFIGNGQPFAQPLLLEDLREKKVDALRAAVEADVAVLAIDGGYELLGRTYETAEGDKLEGLGILDVEIRCGQKRLVGNCAFVCEELDTVVVGFENHAGHATLGSGVKPLGKILAGGGNNGVDGTEGARYRNVFASYAHGSLLPKNPILCDYILKLALERKYGQVALTALDDTIETAAHDYMVQRLSAKS